MKHKLFSTLAVISGLLLMSCDRPPAGLSQTATTQAGSPAGPGAPGSPTTDENAVLEQEIADLKTQEAELRLQIEQDRLAQEKDELERQRAELAKEKAAAAATPAAAPSPVPSAVSASAGSRTESVSSSAGGRDYQMFYESLAPYGQWMETSAYGYVWRPTSRAAGWRPYTVGRWADSNQGWTWVSDEPFGWATYHYGRWALLESHGWIWVPGDTWAPAWVAWRNNADLVGWSPLPPETVYVESGYGPRVDDDYGISADCYTFMPVRYFDAPVYDHCYPVLQNYSCFGLTIGITHIAFHSGYVHCGGPDRFWVNSCLPRPMPYYRIDRDYGYGYGDRYDYRPRFDNDRLSYYSPRVRNSWNEGLRPSRLDGRLDDVRVVRRQDSFRGELGQQYQAEQRERRVRATAALQQEPVRRLAGRQGALEKVRAQRDQLSQRRAGTGREPSTLAASTGLPDRSATSDVTRGEGARQNTLQNERLEASRKELRVRQEEVGRLRQQREGKAQSTADIAPQRGTRAAETARTNSLAGPVNNGRPERAAAEETSPRRGEAGAPETRQREELRQRQEEVAQLRQQRETVRNNQAQAGTPRGQRKEEAGSNEAARQQREEIARRTQASNADAATNQTRESQRRPRNNEADQARDATSRREVAQQTEQRQRAAEAQQRGAREGQANGAREEAARREQARQNDSRQRSAEAQQRSQRESQANQARAESAPREQARQNESRQRSAQAQQRSQRESQANQARAESARREQARQNESRQRSAQAQQRSQRESQANQARAESARREQARQNESRQRSAEAQQRSQRESQANQARAESARRDQARQQQQNDSRQRMAAQQQERSNRQRAASAPRPQAAPPPPRQQAAPPQSRKPQEPKSDGDKKQRGR